MLLPAAAQQPIGPAAGRVVSNWASQPTLYTLAGQLLRSTDSGATWVAIPIRPLGTRQPAIAALATDRTNPAVVYAALAAADGTFFKSLDRGQTWRQTTAGLPAAADGTALVS